MNGCNHPPEMRHPRDPATEHCDCGEVVPSPEWGAKQSAFESTLAMPYGEKRWQAMQAVRRRHDDLMREYDEWKARQS